MFKLPPLEITLSAWKAAEGARVAEQALGRVTNATKITRDELGRFQKRIVDTEPYVNALTRELTSLDKVVGAVGLAFAFKQGVSAAAAFEQQIATIQGVTNASAQDMARLTTAARELGATSRYSATQVAGALLTLTRAGQTVDQALSTVSSILNLAQSEMVSMDEAADLVVGTLSQFQIAAGESVRVVDVLVASSNAANTSAVELGMALKFAGTFAATAGVSFEETAAALAVLSNNNLRGMLGGTSLRAIIALLVNDTDELRTSLGALNLKYEDVDVTVRGIVPVLKTLRDAGLDTKSALDIFGREAGPGALALTRQISDLERIIDLNNNATGASKALSDTVSNTLSGSFDRLKNSFDQVAISAGDTGALGILKAIVVTMTDVVLVSAGMDDSIRGNATAAHLFANALEAVIVATSVFYGLRLAVVVYDVAKAFMTAKTAAQLFQLAVAETGVGLIAVAIGVLVAALVDFSPAAGEATTSNNAFNESLERTKQLSEAGANAIGTYRDALKSNDTSEQIRQLDLMLASIKAIENENSKLQGQSRIGPVVDAKQYESLFSFNEKSKASYRELFRETVQVGEDLFTTINDDALKGTEKYFVYTSSLKNAATTLMHELQAERSKFAKTGAKTKPEVLDTGAARDVVATFMSEMEQEFLRGQDPLKAAADKAEAALRKAFKDQKIGPSELQIAQVRQYAENLYNLEQAIKEADEAQKKAADAQRDHAREVEELQVRVRGVLSAKEDEIAILREEDPLRRRQIEAVKELNRLIGDNKPENYNEIKSQLEGLVKTQYDLVKATEDEKTVRERAEKIKDVGATTAKLRTEIALIKKYGDSTDQLTEARERASQVADFQAKVEEAYRADVIGATAATKDFESALNELMITRRKSAARRDQAELTRDLETEFAALTRSNVEREHATDIAKMQSAAEKIYGANTKEATDAVATYTAKLRELEDAKKIASLADDAGDALGKTFADAVYDIKNADDALESLIRNLSRMAFEQLAVQQVSSTFSSLIKSVAITPSALGNVFSSGTQVDMFANGAVFSSGHMFQMRGGRYGVLGEAGDEAAMPLTRNAQGQLAVHTVGDSSGRRGGLVMNVYTQSGDSFVKAAPHIRREMRRAMR